MDNVWKSKLGVDEDCKPNWRVLYKPPLTKKAGDIQWKVLHGTVAVNAFVSVINHNVQSGCPFCDMRETVFHCFMECDRLVDLFSVLKGLFFKFGEVFSFKSFIFGPKYYFSIRKKSQLLNFLVGQAKLVIYISSKNKIESKTGQEVLLMFKEFVKARILVDYKFYKAMNNCEFFLDQWCYNVTLCTLSEDNLIFIPTLE